MCAHLGGWGPDGMPDDPPPPGFRPPRFLATLRAAREFGLDSRTVSVLSLRFNPHDADHGQLVDALAKALLDRGLIEVPAAP